MAPDAHITPVQNESALSRQTTEGDAADSLVIEVLSLPVNLVFQGEVKGDVLHSLLDENFGA